MKSPFPGMDPYLEGYLWADVHQALASQIRRQLVPLVRPKYAVRLAISMVPDQAPAEEIGVVYPDVNILRVRELAEAYRLTASNSEITPASLSLELSIPTQAILVSVEVRDTDFNKLITSIEILSPANKREPGLTKYLAKREELRKANVHLLEIDLLRRGTRPWSDASLPDCAYLMTLIRAKTIRAEAWPLGLRQRLPILPVPLREPDDDVPLDLQEALNTIYAEAEYQFTLNYNVPPPPPALSAEDAAWAAECVAVWQVGNREKA